MNIQILIIILLAGITLTILIKRFSGSRYGSLRPSQETTNSYLAFRVDPSLAYYLSGSDVYPNAIIGIDKSWSLQSDLWKPLAMDPKVLKELVESMMSLGMQAAVIPCGYEIFDDREVKIGDWFSLPGQNITVWLRGDHRFELSTPNNLYGLD